MTEEMTIERQNEMIAVFDGWEIIPGRDHSCFSCDEGKGPSMYCTCDQKKTRYRKDSTTNDRPPYYNLYWEKLMPVGKKIFDLVQEDIKKRPPHTLSDGDFLEFEISCAIREYDLKKAHEHVFNFVKWHTAYISSPEIK